MLPPGHIAGGYLVAWALIKVAQPDLDAYHLQQLLYAGAFFGFAPDLDFFLAFGKVKGLTLHGHETINHRNFYTHAPLNWLVVGLLVYALASTTFIKYIGLLLWLGSWSHFALDSLQYGIMWLWPFSSYHYTLKDREIQTPIAPRKGFVVYWLNFLKFYTAQLKLTFYAEIIIIFLALYVALHSL